MRSTIRAGIRPASEDDEPGSAGSGPTPAEGSAPGTGSGPAPAEGSAPGAGSGSTPAEGSAPGAGSGSAGIALDADLLASTRHRRLGRSGLLAAVRRQPLTPPVQPAALAVRLAGLVAWLAALPARVAARTRRRLGRSGLLVATRGRPLRLPALLAIAVSVVLVAAGGSALAVAATSSGSHPARLARVGITGVVPLAAALPTGTGKGSGAAASATTATSRPRAAVTATTLAGNSIVKGLAVPAGGLPLSVNQDPAQTGGSDSGGHGPAVTLPTPNAATLPTVAGLTDDQTPDAVDMLSAPLTAAQIAALSHLSGVTAIETVDTGTVSMGGDPVVAFGVDPGTFRDFTPAASAASDQLWRYLAGGSLVSSYEMADDRNLALGSTQTIVPSVSAPDSSVKGWLGAFAAIGLPGVDLLVDHQYSSALGLTPDSGLVVVAPSLSGAKLEAELQSAVPDGAVELLYPNQLPTDLPGNILTGTVRQRIIAAALSRIGLPYVWGGAGPNTFDCSGLVQWSYRQAGILMPRVAAEQFLTGDHIPLADAQPGDLLFWAYDPEDPGYIDHVAIYLGNGMMVVAPHTGTDVQIAPVTTQDFAGAVEVVLSGS